MYQISKPGCLILEYCPGGDLFSLISKAGYLKSKNIQFYGACILLALEYLHENSILFKDLKSENVIISKEGFAKLIDFSLSEHQNSTECKIDYMVANQISAPEVLEKHEFTEASDWWSYGCLLYEMAVGVKPFEGLSYYQIKKYILTQQPDFHSTLDPSLIDLLSLLLEKDPSLRINCSSQIRRHPFFSNSSINFEYLNDPIRHLKTRVPTKPKLDFDSDTYYFDKKFTKMSLSEIDFLQSDIYNGENSPTSTSTQSSCCIKS